MVPFFVVVGGRQGFIGRAIYKEGAYHVPLCSFVVPFFLGGGRKGGRVNPGGALIILDT